MFLHRAIKDKDDKMRSLIKCLTLTLQPDDLIKIHNLMQKPWGLEDQTIIPEFNDQNTVRFTRKQMNPKPHQQQNNRSMNRQCLSRANSNSIKIQFDDQDTVSECSQQSIIQHINVSQKFQDSMVQNFKTYDEDLEQFKQNDEKDYQEEEMLKNEQSSSSLLG